MRKKEISFKQLRMWGVLLSVALFLFVYLNVYDRYNKKTEETRAEIETVQNQILLANQQLEQQKEMEQKIKGMDAKIDEILTKYPAGQTVASNIMFLKTMEEANKKIEFLNVSLGDISIFKQTTIAAEYPEEEIEDSGDSDEHAGNTKWIKKSSEESVIPADNSVDSSEDPSVDSTTTDESDNTIDMTYDPTSKSDTVQGIKTTINVSFQGKYDAVKEYIQYLEEFETKVTIDEMSVAYDTTTGQINGSTTITIYAITGSGKEFVEPDLSGVEIGRLRIFE